MSVQQVECLHVRCGNVTDNEYPYLCDDCVYLPDRGSNPVCPHCQSEPAPTRTEFCDHVGCQVLTPGADQLICNECTSLFNPDAPNECGKCHDSITS